MWKLLIAADSWAHMIDVGANYGEMLVKVELTPAAKVIAVEPNPRVVPYLERTLT
jgi:FkbM family methyltransferase